MKLSFECDKGSATKAAFGLILLSVDETIESEFRPLFHQEAVSLLHARIGSAPEVTSEKLMQMKARLMDTAALLPGTRPLDVIAYGCTSGATVIGSDEVGKDPKIEAVFASCTNLRTLPVIETCERRLGKPVISSNLALAWHMMHLAGLPTAGRGPGRLFAA
jgi:maleate cis-trans isomerase